MHLIQRSLPVPIPQRRVMYVIMLWAADITCSGLDRFLSDITGLRNVEVGVLFSVDIVSAFSTGPPRAAHQRPGYVRSTARS